MTAAGDRDLVLDVLRRVGGRVALEEIAYKAKLTRAAALRALVELEEQGLAAPMSWEAIRHQEAA